MKRYQFSLEAVRRARQVQQDLAQAELRQAQVAALAAEAALARSLDHYAEVRSERPATFTADRERAGLAARAAIEAREAVDRARTLAQAAMEEYVSASRQVTVLERLDERLREEHALAFQREEGTVSDELATSRHLRHRARRKRKATA
ncbi:MAG TPA: hypothetical protein VK425_11290 [Acidimicrobiales bacterium]|nr:hypothetical protein [Acidimicrobiales bacterium]